jgi:hypothetical protein
MKLLAGKQSPQSIERQFPGNGVIENLTELAANPTFQGSLSCKPDRNQSILIPSTIAPSPKTMRAINI